MNNKFSQWGIGFLIALIILFLRLTCRIRIQDQPQDLNKKPAIVTLWHGRLLMMPFLFPKKKKVHALISAHKDGRIIQKTAAFFGIRTITGSSSKGGANALRGMVRKIKQGQTIFITPDGPKGPRCKAQAGALELSRMTGASIFPVSINFSKSWKMSSWDKFEIPKPFSIIYIHWGKSLKVENKEERNEIQDKLEKTLNTLQESRT